MVEFKYTGDALWDRIERAVEIVKQRTRRVTEALNAANVPYAIIGGNAVQHWVGQVDATWLPRFSPELQARLQELLDDPDG